MVDVIDPTPGTPHWSRFISAVERIADAQERMADEKSAESETVSKEAMAIALVFTMDNPTKRKIAKAIGYANHAALRGMAKFAKAWEAHKISLTFQAGDGRSIDHSLVDESEY